jgi:hypothetical protein
VGKKVDISGGPNGGHGKSGGTEAQLWLEDTIVGKYE